MSFLAGRLAGTEGAYFLQESKQAVCRLLQNNKVPGIVGQITNNGEASSVSPLTKDAMAKADVLPEVLRNSLPPQIFHSSVENSSSSSLSRASKWVIESDTGKGRALVASAEALNPLKAYVSLPQVTFGPKRWQLPSMENSVLASTANDLRHDKYSPVNPEKLKAAAAGLSQIGSAFAVATAIVFGGFTGVCVLAASKLDVHNAEDIRTRGKDLVQPRFEMMRERLSPLRSWADDMSKNRPLGSKDSFKERPLIKELSRTLGPKIAT